MTKQALGKGLHAFIPQEFGILKEERYAELDLEQLRPNPLQPRHKFDEARIDELARSMRATGVVQPVLVVPEDKHYKIIVGERRWRAAQKAGLKKIPVLIRNIPRDKQLEVSLIENIHREELNPIEIALAYQRLIQELGCTQQELADKVGKDRASVANYLRILKLPREIQAALDDGRITFGHAKALLALETAALQLRAYKEIIDKGLPVRAAERVVGQMKERPPRAQRSLEDPDLAALQEDLVKAVGTKVQISGSRARGVVKIFYFSLDELNRIYVRMKAER